MSMSAVVVVARSTRFDAAIAAAPVTPLVPLEVSSPDTVPLVEREDKRGYRYAYLIERLSSFSTQLREANKSGPDIEKTEKLIWEFGNDIGMCGRPEMVALNEHFSTFIETRRHLLLLEAATANMPGARGNPNLLNHRVRVELHQMPAKIQLAIDFGIIALQAERA